MTEKNSFIDDYEEKSVRSRKKLAPLYIKQIIEECSNCKKMLSAQQIIDYLDAYPYSMELERKAVSRTIKMLSDFYPYIVKDEITGRVWFDKEAPKHYPAA